MKRILLAMSLLLCSFISSTVYSQCPSDNGGNTPYNDGWGASDNGGSGFNVWNRTLTSGDGSRNGFFIGNSNSNGDGGTYGIGSSCWALYANNSQTASATRAFTNTLSIGGTLSFGMDNGWIDNGAVVGFGIQNASGENLVEFYYIGNSNKYKINDNGNQNDTSLDFTDDGLTFTFSRTDANNYSLVVTRLESTTTITLTGALKSPAGGKVPAQVRFFNFNAGGGNERNAFFNNLSITDNPIATATNVSGCAGSAITLVGSGLPSGGTGIYSIANPYTGPSTTYTYTYTAPNGCSTTSAPASVTVNPLTTNGSVTTSICAGETYVWPANGQSYTTTQTNLTHVVGCNTATLNLSITPQPTWYLDADDDGYYTGTPIVQCASPGIGYTTTVLGGGDCDDTRNFAYPGATEICFNNVDDDCDGLKSEGCQLVASSLTNSYPNNFILGSISTTIMSTIPVVPGYPITGYIF
ncbi:MopE-related protein, partial [Flavobacterium sp.]|uniref:MopE-related protein n=1 Tax=Flavobacterium sp. TaxID=239 RepID=UPI003919F62C